MTEMEYKLSASASMNESGALFFLYDFDLNYTM